MLLTDLFIPQFNSKYSHKYNKNLSQSLPQPIGLGLVIVYFQVLFLNMASLLVIGLDILCFFVYHIAVIWLSVQLITWKDLSPK